MPFCRRCPCIEPENRRCLWVTSFVPAVTKGPFETVCSPFSRFVFSPSPPPPPPPPPLGGSKRTRLLIPDDKRRKKKKGSRKLGQGILQSRKGTPLLVDLFNGSPTTISYFHWPKSRYELLVVDGLVTNLVFTRNALHFIGRLEMASSGCEKDCAKTEIAYSVHHELYALYSYRRGMSLEINFLKFDFD